MAFSSAASELGESPAPISKSEYRERQEKLYSKLSDNLYILCSSPTTVRSNDVHHPYRTSSDLLYSTGWSEPDSVMLATKKMELGKQCCFFNLEILN